MVYLGYYTVQDQLKVILNTFQSEVSYGCCTFIYMTCAI